MTIKKIEKSWWIISSEYGNVGPYNKKRRTENEQ